MENKFNWIPFYEELADKLLEYKDRRADLIAIIKQIYNENGLKLPTLEQDNEIIDIDPFTIFGLFNKGITNKKRISIIQVMKRMFSISSEVPSDFDGIPVLNNLSATFYRFKDDRDANDIQNLWNIFEFGKNYADEPNNDNKEKFIKAFDIITEQKGIKWNITIGLFWIRPYFYLSLDGQIRAFIANSENKLNAILDISPQILRDKVPKGENYLKICEECKRKFTLQEYKFKSFPEMSHFAWVNNADLNDDLEEVKEFANIVCLYYARLHSDDQEYKENCTKIFKEIADFTGIKLSTMRQTKDIFDAQFDNGRKGYYQKPIENQRKALFHVYLKYKDMPMPEIKILVDGVLEKICNIPVDDTQQNYWWLTVNPNIWSFSSLSVGEKVSYSLYNEKGNKRRIFQNFLDAKVGDSIIAYESSPVKKVVGLAKVSQEQDGNCLYFEKTHELSNFIEYQMLYDCKELEEMEYFQNPHGSMFKLSKEEYTFIVNLISYKEIEASKRDTLEKYIEKEFLEDVYIDENEYETIKNLLLRKKNLILQGAPGVGKTFAAKRLAYSIMGEQDESRISVIQFHQRKYFGERF